MATSFLASHGIDIDSLLQKTQFGTSDSSSPSSSSLAPPVSKILNATLPNHSSSQTHDLTLHPQTHKILSIKPHTSLPASLTTSNTFNASARLLAPSLCHPHIHLDKAFLLSHPKYSDLSITQGDFAEAMNLTSQAKARFERDDLLERGRWVVRESIEAGVTAMRAFVEVDDGVRFKCLETGLELKHEFAEQCEVQICAFAQEAVFTGERGEKNRSLMEEAVRREGVDVLGATPYVESDTEKMKECVQWAVETAISQSLHLDLHLDYNLDPAKEALIWFVLETLHAKAWTQRNPSKKIVLGHCTRLTLFSPSQWQDLKAAIADLPLSFVGLPTSDLFMMAKPSPSNPASSQRVRGTLQIPEMIQHYGLQAAIGVNNVGNAFTPQGSLDPLSVASLGVGVYQAGTKKDGEVLFECVSGRAKRAIGLEEDGDAGVLEVREGGKADFVVFGRDNEVGGRRPNAKTVQEVVYEPPKGRVVFCGGRRVAG